MKALIAVGILWSGFAQANMDSPLAPRTEAVDGNEVIQVAAAEPVVQDGKSLMDQVVDWYNAGQDITYAEAKGYYVGRCFSFDDVNKGKNSLFTPMGINNGPGFPEEGKLLATLTFGNGLPANKYDHVEKASEVSKGFWDYYGDKLGSKRYGPINESPLRQQSDLEVNGRMDFEHTFRKNGDYIVSVVTNLISQKLFLTIMTKEKYAKAGDVVFACYYFKKLAE